jgi:hypothetical protein
MAKSKLGEAADAAKSVAGAALGAAAIAATGVVLSSMAQAFQKGGKQLGEATPALQDIAARTISQPLLPKRSKLAAGRASKTANTKRRATKRGPVKARSKR